MDDPTHFPKSALVRVNGVDLEVFEAGQDNGGDAIVLCHGWPEHAYSWRHQLHALADAGHHVIAPNQRGYGNSTCPQEVEAYDVEQLTGDIVGLLDHYGHEQATVIGHDWGAMVAWGTALLHPDRVRAVAALALPYQERGEQPWIEWMEATFGPDFYFVHFNRQPGVADAVFDDNTAQFLRNVFRTNLPPPPADPPPGMGLINLAEATAPIGDAIMTEEELAVTVASFETTGFTPSINWYRNLDRNWHLLADVDPIIDHPALMIYGSRDMVAQSPNLEHFVPNVEVVTLDSGHWIQQERPEETNRVLLDWLRGNPVLR